MRELLFKNTTTWKKNMRDIFVKEVIQQGDVLAKTTKRCLYFIKNRVRIEDPSDIKNIAGIKSDNDAKKRHFYVLKEHDSKLGVDKLMCKVAGTFYAVVNDYLYCIVFIHTFKISFLPATKQ